MQVIELQRKGYIRFMRDKWREQGDLVNIDFGPVKMLLAIHPDHVRHVAIDAKQKYDKQQSYKLVRQLLLGNGLVSSSGDLWRRQRKLMSPFFTPRGIEQFTSIMLEDGKQLAARWETLAEQGKPVDITDEMMQITASIILKTMFSVQINSAMLELKGEIETLITSVTKRNYSAVKLPLWLPTPQHRKYRRARRLVHDYIKGIIAQRRNIPETEWPDDLLSRLMRARDEDTGQRMDDQQVFDESLTIFVAGHETTARTLTFTWYALSENPQVAARLQAELDEVLQGRDPQVADLKKLPYTLQVIKETLRLYPAAPIYPRDVVEDDILDGKPVKPGMTILFSPYMTHRHPSFWPEPEKYDPERWTPEREKAQHPYAYHPFAAGQRICIGNNFSLLESHILLALLAARFAPRLVPGHQPKIEAEGVLTVKNGMSMYIEKRHDTATEVKPSVSSDRLVS